MHNNNLVLAGQSIDIASKALIMVHGRGAYAQDILTLADHLQVKDYALCAPQAANNTWYPYSFLAPPGKNEPFLSSAILEINSAVKHFVDYGITYENIFFLGFSQGACLTLEYIARNAQRYGGIVAFTGGLIGDKIYNENYKGNFLSTPIFIGTSNPDMHVPVERVYATTNILKDMGADVTEKVYNNMGHTINSDEIEMANKIVFK